MEASNVKAMREALEIAKKAICNHARACHTCDSLAWENSTINANCADILCAHRDLCKAKTAIQKALSAPPRNCDLGTAEEQEVRFRNYCWNHSSRDKNMECQCPIDTEGKAGCKLEWAQMPYEE